MNFRDAVAPARPGRRGRAALIVSIATVGIVAFGGLPASAASSSTAKARVQVSAASNFNCAVTLAKTVQCWGSDAGGEEAVPSGRYSYVSAGFGGYACAITVSKTLKCWGGGPDGLPTGILDPPAGKFIALSSGEQFACAIATSKAVTCWGNNPDVVGMQPAGAFTAVAAGATFACAIDTGGKLECWGDPDAPLSPPAGTFTAVTASPGVQGGRLFGCAITANGRVSCWGPGAGNILRPPAEAFSSISASPLDVCGLSGQRVICWGNSAQGILNPQAGKYTGVSTGLEYACAVTTANLVHCWGQPGFGDLGARPATPAPVPSAHATQGEAYAAAFHSSAGSPAGTFRVSSGTLPPGLKLSGRGALSGTPTTAGTFTFTVTVSNLIGSKHRQFTITVASA